MARAPRNRLSHRGLLVAAMAALLLLVGLGAVVLVNGGSTSLPASNAAADCVAPAGPTARGYGESGAAGATGDPSCVPGCEPSGSASGVTARGYGESGAAGVTDDRSCDPPCVPKGSAAGSGSAGGTTARGYGESGAGGVTAPPVCDPCPAGGSPGGATGRGYGESGASGVMPKDDCVAPGGAAAGGDGGDADGAAAPSGNGRAGGADAAAPAPVTGGGGTRQGRVPGATGRASPQPAGTTNRDASPTLEQPVSAAVVGQTSGRDGARKNTALVVGGLVLLLVAVAVVLRRGRPGFAR
jgi:hypothetical protein